jgi:hypothetical protein
MLSPSRVGCLISLLVASGCAGNSGDGGQTGTAQESGTSTGSSGAQSAGGGTTGSDAASGSSGGNSGVVGATGSSGMASGAPSSGSSGSAAAGAGSATASGNGASGQASGVPEGGSSGAATEAGTTSAGPFTCNLVLGLFTTSQWFSGMSPGGASKTFLMDGVDATRWEGKQTKYAYIEKWLDPTNSVWSLALTNPCATNSGTPDRIIFVGFSPGVPADQDYQMYSSESTNEAGWVMLLNSVIATIKMKYPTGVKEIDILTMGRAPNNVLCSNNNDVDTIIQPYEDAAYEEVAAASGGFIIVGPKYYVPDCATSYIFANDSDYTTTAANAIATQVAAYYVAHP